MSGRARRTPYGQSGCMSGCMYVCGYVCVHVCVDVQQRLCACVFFICVRV